MTEALSAAGAVELAVVERSGFEEARHLGAAVLTAPDGTPEAGLGDIHSLVFARSALKPFQALAAQQAGAGLRGEQLAVTVASHTGTLDHVRLVRAVLAGAGLDEGALGCPAAWPRDQKARDLAVALGDHPRPVTMTCSGKHAGFLAACRAAGWDTGGYLEPDHPLQQLIVETVSELAGEPVAAIGVDGCGAPVHALSIAGVALAMSRLVRDTGGAGSGGAGSGGAESDGTGSGRAESAGTGRAIFDAAVANGWAIEGPGTPDSTVIDELGVFAKFGADGFLLLGTADGRAVAVKVLDGSRRATALIGLELLARAGAVDRADADRVIAAVTPPVLGGGHPVGRIHPAF